MLQDSMPSNGISHSAAVLVYGLLYCLMKKKGHASRHHKGLRQAQQRSRMLTAPLAYKANPHFLPSKAFQADKQECFRFVFVFSHPMLEKVNLPSLLGQEEGYCMDRFRKHHLQAIILFRDPRPCLFGMDLSIIILFQE